ncbi:MAG TPA: GntR family transcriptional regulator [Abditibacterium sp.]|jgi:DNA-binding GntR family transcriptional regulator
MNDNTFLRQKAYAIIQAKILQGELRAGALVSELALAQEIGMSRTPVREAIGQLEREGLFNKVPRVGTIVRLPGYQELKDLYEVREALESQAAQVAAQTLSREDFDTMERLVEEVHQIAVELRHRHIDILDEALLHRFFSADIAFHLLIIRAAGNRRILEIVSEFRIIQRVFEYDRMSHDRPLVEGAAAQHGEILAALRQGNTEAARLAVATHIRAAQNIALASFEESSRSASNQVLLKLPDDVSSHIQNLGVAPLVGNP